MKIDVFWRVLNITNSIFILNYFFLFFTASKGVVLQNIVNDEKKKVNYFYTKAEHGKNSSYIFFRV